MKGFADNKHKFVQVIVLFILIVLCLVGVSVMDDDTSAQDEYYYSLQEVSEDKYVYYTYNLDYSMEGVAVVVNNELKTFSGNVVIKFTEGQPRMIQSTNEIVLYVPHDSVVFVRSI